jgi:Mce-associated membrane protein
MDMTSIATKPTLPERSLIQRTFPGGPLRAAIIALATLAGLAVVGAGWFGVSWYRAAHDESLAAGMERDAVLRDAERAILTLNTLDYRQVQDGLTLWEQAATGSLLEQLRTNRDTYARAITDSTTISSAKVLDAAVAALDARAGTAEVLAGVDVTSAMDKGNPGCAHRRVRMDMVRAGGSWKVSTLTPVGETYSEVGPCPPTAIPN